MEMFLPSGNISKIRIFCRFFSVDRIGFRNVEGGCFVVET